MLESEEKRWVIRPLAFVQELKKASSIAAPMVVVSILQYLLQVVSIIMVGHLGELSLSGVAIATSLTNVTGFSLLSGMAGGLETLCGQAYGAEQFQKLGTYTYTAIISLVLVCPPVCVLWIFMDKILILLGQDPTISLEACKYSMWLIPALFGAIAFGSSTWLNVILLSFFTIYSSACGKTRVPFSKDVLLGISEFYRLAIPSAVMVCLKWWSCELLTLLSGLLPNAKLETSVLSICLTISTLHFTVAYGFGAAASTRISNELGAGNPQAARVTVWATMFLSITEGIIVIVTLFFCRYVLGYAYSNEKQVVNYIAVMAPLICLSILMDSLQAVLSGVARGSGWQHIGAYVNLGAFYLVGLPVGAVLGFVLHLRGKGLWIGIISGSIVQSTLLSLITGFTNWKKQAAKARERIFERKSSVNSQSDRIHKEET
ncbi:hypothetical protein CMV_018001 [Castanea mollissima]|uniref:Multidrug and toxic compound extrusion protein n=1 Tax=Castanea mollissima TaxID=60419 RepID=A0A8J4VGK6_9ROSI|nr:hypothetical protein CMV_018001 [Castanea mollissima]